jgi:hypothetical protein
MSLLCGTQDQCSHITFPGGHLELTRFSIREKGQQDGHCPLEYVVLVALPVMSDFEVAVNTRIPGWISAVNSDSTGRIERSGIIAPIYPMDEQWALGGKLAARAITTLKKRWTCS